MTGGTGDPHLRHAAGVQTDVNGCQREVSGEDRGPCDRLALLRRGGGCGLVGLRSVLLLGPPLHVLGNLPGLLGVCGGEAVQLLLLVLGLGRVALLCIRRGSCNLDIGVGGRVEIAVPLGDRIVVILGVGIVVETYIQQLIALLQDKCQLTSSAVVVEPGGRLVHVVRGVSAGAGDI